MGHRYGLWRSFVYTYFFYSFIGTILGQNRSQLLIISLDGFRQQYLKTYSFPALKRIENEGVKTINGMKPTYVTMTFPNHISIATGMYQEDHGVIHNRFFDKKLNKTISFGTRDEGQWSDRRVEPLWITATKQNKKSAVLFWPACHNEFHGIRPLIYSWVYSDAIPLREKIDNAISYFKQLSFDLVMLYHFEPDHQGHIYGPDSNETHAALLRLDDHINYLLSKVKSELDDNLNVIILSDHGMANVKRIIHPFLNYINKSSVEESILDGPMFSVTPHSGKYDEVFNGLRRIPNVTVYSRSQFPAKFNYAKAAERLEDIIVIPNDEGAVFSQTIGDESVRKGNHGYDNALPSMQAIFMARGPDFQSHTEIDSLRNVDIYHIACKILNIQPNVYANAGSLKNLSKIFRTNINKSSRLCVNVSLICFLKFLIFNLQI